MGRDNDVNEAIPPATDVTNEEHAPVDAEEYEMQVQEQVAAAQASLFPAPPMQAALYTREHIRQHAMLQKARGDDQGSFDWDNAPPQDRLKRQGEILKQAAEAISLSSSSSSNPGDDVKMDGNDDRSRPTLPCLLPSPDWDVLLTMDPPRVDWIEEDGFYSCFGETWPVEDKLLPLREMGMRQIYPDKLPDRRAAMVTLLRTMLKSYLQLIDVLLDPPQEYLGSAEPGLPPSWRFVSQDKAKDINDLGINLMHLLNEMRPLQAKQDLRTLLQRQLARRKEEAELIRLQCQQMRTQLTKLHQAQS